MEPNHVAAANRDRGSFSAHSGAPVSAAWYALAQRNIAEERRIEVTVQRDLAEKRRNEARARELAAHAQNAIRYDPQLAIYLAERAVLQT